MAAPTIPQSIDTFLRSLTNERNMAPRTVEAYRYELERWHQAFTLNYPQARSLADVDAYALKDYLASAREERLLKPATLSRMISSLRVFFQWATLEGYIESTPARTLHNPKKARRIPLYLTAPEVHHLVRSSPSDKVTSFRDKTILQLLVMTGMRLSELVGLNTQDIDFERGSLKVLGKGRKERLIPLNDAARQLLNAWLVVRWPTNNSEPALFTTPKGRRITRRMVQYLVRKGVKAAGLDPRISPHKLRHTFATHLYAEAVDLRDIQELLGHSNIASTSVYTHTNVDKVRAAVNKLRL